MKVSEFVFSVRLSFRRNSCSTFVTPAVRGRDATVSLFCLFGEGHDLFPCRGVEEKGAQSNPRFRPRSQRGLKFEGGENKTLGLTVYGGTVCFGFPRRADDPHETVSELFQNHPLGLHLRLMSLFGFFRLFKETLARRFQHFLCDKRVRQPARRERFKSEKT